LAQLLGRTKLAIFGCHRRVGDKITPELVYRFAVWGINDFTNFLVKTGVLFNCVEHDPISLADTLRVRHSLRCV
jgi:hypothetical protein